MSLTKPISSMFPHTITRRSVTMLDAHNSPTFGASSQLKCQIDEETRITRNNTGELVTIRYTIILLDDIDIKVDDEITLPSGDVPQISHVRKITDIDNTKVVVIYAV